MPPSLPLGAISMDALVLFTWGFAEATLFFIVPDVFVAFIGLQDGGAAESAAWWAVAGSVAGGLVLAVWTRRRPSGVSDALAHVPAISGPMIDAVAVHVARSGSIAMVLGPARGIPFKLYVNAMAERPVLVLLPLMAVARAARMVPVAWVSGWSGRRLVDGFGLGLPTVLWLYSILTVAGYAWYFRSIRRRFG
jgi:membrane protein YqaA with SNARE-associated domain